MEMQKIIKKLNDATAAYNEGHPYMSDKEWDDLYFDLQQAERETGIIYPNSPTQKVVYSIPSELQKVKHDHPMLSLDKTKNDSELLEFIEAFPKAGCVEMLKMDGLTCSLHYNDHVLVSAETRGDGEIGEDVTHNATVIKNIPKRIPYSGQLIVDGEIICKYSDFEPFSYNYKNPRNFASGSIRLLDNSECRQRNLSFICWDIINDIPEKDTLSSKLEFAQEQGFEVVPWITYSGSSTLEYDKQWLKKKATENGYPIDGLVYKYDDCATYEKLGYTEHHFRGGLAYKFYDETYTTHLQALDWDVSRTGTLTPVAVFDPVDINGSTVSRASVHNLTLLEETLGTPYVGEEIEVFKANDIIPQIYSAVKASSSNVIKIPTVCPVCGEKLIQKKDGIALTLQCVNNNCRGKVLTKLEHFVSKPCLNIEGLARSTLEAMYDSLCVRSFSDIYSLTKAKLAKLPGFAETSVNNIYEAIQKSKEVSLCNFLTAIGIPNIGSKQAEQLCSICTNWNDFVNKAFSGFDWSIISGFGEKKSQSVNSFNYVEAIKVAEYLQIRNKQESIEIDTTSLLNNKHIVITGSLYNFKNRSELISLLQEKGAIVQSGVNKQTDFLINNDITSNSSKNKKAKELGVRIITEEQLITEFNL